MASRSRLMWHDEGRVSLPLIALFRLAALLTVPLLAEPLGPVESWSTFALVLVYVGVTSLRPGSLYVQAADVAVAAVLVFTLGSITNPYMAFILLTAALPGVTGTMRAGLLSGATIAIVHLTDLALEEGLPMADLDVLLPSLSLPLVIGLTGGLFGRILEENHDGGRVALQRTNQLLIDLQEVARETPGALDAATVARAALEEIETVSRPEFGTVMVLDAGLLVPVALRGFEHTTVLPVHADEVESLLGSARPRPVAVARLPAPLRELCEETDASAVVIAPLTIRAESMGLLLVGFSGMPVGDAHLRQIDLLARDLSIALDNVRLLEATQTHALDSSRRQVAHHLHDSVAQALTHLRMELELLALTAEDDSTRTEAERLTKVAERSLLDVRATIGRLQPGSRSTLVAALERHAQQLDGLGGVNVSFELVGVPPPALDEERDLLRLAQSAIILALRRPTAREVRVRLHVQDDGVSFTVTALEEQDESWEDLRLPGYAEELAHRSGTRTSVWQSGAGHAVIELTKPIQRRARSGGPPPLRERSR